MKLRMLWIGLAVAGLALAGCATTDKKEGEGAGAGAATSGAGETGAAGGAAMGAGARADLLAKRVVYFDFDSATIDDESRAIIEAHAANLAANPALKVKLSGHCDERGTREYNLALGERRAQAVEKLMRVLGVSASRMSNVSYGEEKPVCAEHNESCWRQNRRVEISY